MRGSLSGIQKQQRNRNANKKKSSTGNIGFFFRVFSFQPGGERCQGWLHITSLAIFIGVNEDRLASATRAAAASPHSTTEGEAQHTLCTSMSVHERAGAG